MLSSACILVSKRHCSHDRVGQEVDPDAVPPDAVLLDDLVLVRDPVEVPSVDGSRVVDTEHIDRLDLKVGRLELIDEHSSYYATMSRNPPA